MSDPIKVGFYDIIIVGAGIPGLTLADKLANTNLSVAILDKDLPNSQSTEFSTVRVSAITPASKKILAQLPLWQQQQSTFKKVHIWTPAGNYLDYDSADVGEPALGYIIENQLIQSQLYQLLNNCTNISFIAPVQIQAINSIENKVEVVTDKAIYRTQLLVGADGANSIVRKLSGMEWYEQDYHHTGIIATVNTEKSHQQTAWQCFLPKGPLAFLPLKDAHLSSIVWSTVPDEGEQLLNESDEKFCEALAKASQYQLGNIKTVSKRFSFPLYRRHVKHYIKSNIALIGDAAHTIHPLAGQGLNLGILDADCLAKNILNTQRQNRVIGSYSNLRKYERARKADNILMFGVVDSLKKIFDSSFPPVKLMRNTGLSLVNNLDFVKKFLIRSAIGFRD